MKKRIVGLPISDLEKDLQFEWLDNIRGTKVKKNNRSYITTRIYKDEEIELQGPLLEKSVPNPSSIFFVDSLPTILMVSTKGSNINVFFADDVIPRWKENSNRWVFKNFHTSFLELFIFTKRSMLKIILDLFYMRKFQWNLLFGSIL